MRNRYVACFTPCAPPLLVLTGNTDANGHFSVEFTSPTAGQVIGNATTSFTVNGATETRKIGRASCRERGDAPETAVAVRKRIEQSATNRGGKEHSIPDTVLENLGDGKGFIVPVVI